MENNFKSKAWLINGTDKRNCNFLMDAMLHGCTFSTGNKSDLCCFEIKKNVIIWKLYFALDLVTLCHHGKCVLMYVKCAWKFTIST